MAYVGPAGPAASGADPSDGLRLEVGHLHAVVGSFGVEPVFVLGPGRGAALSTAYARCHPDRVAGLILYATGPVADVRDDPPPLTVPTLVVTDGPDIDSATEPVDVLRHRIPDARLVTLRESGRHAHLAEPERFAYLLLEFTRRVSGPVRTALT